MEKKEQNKLEEKIHSSTRGSINIFFYILSGFFAMVFIFWLAQSNYKKSKSILNKPNLPTSYQETKQEAKTKELSLLDYNLAIEILRNSSNKAKIADILQNIQFNLKDNDLSMLISEIKLLAISSNEIDDINIFNEFNKLESIIKDEKSIIFYHGKVGSFLGKLIKIKKLTSQEELDSSTDDDITKLGLAKAHIFKQEFDQAKKEILDLDEKFHNTAKKLVLKLEARINFEKSLDSLENYLKSNSKKNDKN